MRVIPPDLIAEHEQLKQQFEALQREHAALHEDPHDLDAHAAHRKKLQHHIQDLHAHVLRWRDL
jgi:prefoldin subunit 5